jgi:hypothetical protein
VPRRPRVPGLGRISHARHQRCVRHRAVGTGGWYREPRRTLPRGVCGVGARAVGTPPRPDCCKADIGQEGRQSAPQWRCWSNSQWRGSTMMMPMQTDIPRLPIREDGRAFSSEKAVRPRVRDRPLPYSTNMAAKSESRLAQALRIAAASVQPPANCRKPQEAGRSMITASAVGRYGSPTLRSPTPRNAVKPESGRPLPCFWQYPLFARTWTRCSSIRRRRSDGNEPRGN